MDPIKPKLATAPISPKGTVGSGPQDQWTRSPDPQRANRRYTGGQGTLPNFPEIGEILGKPFSGGVGGETGTPKGLLGTIQSIWVRGNPLISIFETIPPQNHVFRTPFWGPGTSPGQPRPAWPPDKSWIMEDHEGTLARGRVDRGILSNCKFLTPNPPDANSPPEAPHKTTLVCET